jgi:hypothetical protein
MGEPADKPPVLVPFDLEQIDGVLLASARAMAYDINTDVVWKKDDDSGFEWLAGPLQKAYARVRYGTYGWEGPGSVQVQTKYGKVQADTESFHRMFRQNFVRFAATGPGPGMAYLTERIACTQRSWDNMRWRFNSARAVNDEITAELNRSKAITRFFMVAGGVAATVLGAVAPVSWIVSSAGGIGYAITCQLAKSVGVAMSADMVGFQYPESNIVRKTVANSTTAASLANAGISTTINYAQGNRQGLLKVAEEAAAKLEKKLGEFTAQRGANLTRPQRKVVADLARKAGGIGGESNAAKLASQVKYVKGASIGVGLLFMKDDFAALYRDLRDVYRDVTR